MFVYMCTLLWNMHDNVLLSLSNLFQSNFFADLSCQRQQRAQLSMKRFRILVRKEQKIIVYTQTNIASI